MHDTENFKKNIHEDYEIEEELGSGQFAVVRKIVEKETGDEFAAKYVRKKRTKASRNGMSREDIKREIEILRMVDSEKIIKVHDVYETDKEIILVMELLRGGELFDYISKKDFLTEEEAIDFTRQILLGLQHLHSRSVVHLDLKPENILLKNTRRKTIKLVDFGLARVVNENEQVREIMGTPEFVAPEVLNFDTISTATDMWALGVIAYILLSGASPFLGEDNQETFTNIIQVDYQFDEEYFAEISDEAKDFIRKLLVKNPRKRPTAHDCSRHTWVEEEVVDKKKRQRRRTTQICTFNFKRFVARKRWKMSYNKIRAMNLIAKMGIKPPPGFITAIPPMAENNNEIVEPEPVEEKPSSHKEHKKKESTIHRKKHKPASSPKTTVEKTDSLTLKTMDIDIGEVESVEPEPESEPEPEPADENEASDKAESSPVSEEPVEPVDYGSMSKREKRRARGQLRMDEIAKSKKEIDEKQAKLDTDQVVNGDEAAEDAPAMDVEETSPVPAPADEKPAEPQTVTSTMHIEHKPVTNTQSVGILKKSKARRIPSTEDHYFVTLNAALLQQDDTFCPSASSGLQPTRQHSILKHTTSLPQTSDDTTNNSEENTTPSEDVPKGSEVDVSKVSDVVPKSTEDVPKPIENKKVSEFTVVQVNNAPKYDNPGNGGLVGLQMDKAVAHEPDKETGNKSEASKAEIKPSNQNSDATPKNTAQVKEATPAPKKPLTKTDNPPQQRGFTPPPWQRKSSKENMKASPQPLHGVSKVSLKANRFLSNDKQSNPKSPTNSGPVKTSNVLGKSKLFQKEANKQDTMKTAVNKTNSGQELKNVACDISLDDTTLKNGGAEISVSKPRADSQSKVRSDSQSKVRSDSQPKVGSDSQSKVRSDSQPKVGSDSQSKVRSDSQSKVRSDSQSKVRSDSQSKVRSDSQSKVRSDSQSKVRSDSQPKVRSDSQPKSRSNSQLRVLADGQSKPRSDSQSKTRSGSVNAINNKSNNEENAGNNEENASNNEENASNKENKVNASRFRSNSNQKTNSEGKVLNGENAKETKNDPVKRSGVLSLSSVEIPGGHEKQETRTEVKEELTSTSTHSLTEFTIRPRGNSGEEKAGGFDIMLTIGSPTDQPTQESRVVTQEPRAVSAMKTRFTSSSSSLPDPRSGLPNGKLTSLSTNDVTSLSHEPAMSPTADRHGAAQGGKYTPQRDFSKYLNNDPSKSVKTTGVPANTQKTPWQVKRNNPPTTIITPPKTVITPKSPTTPTTRPASIVAKTAAAKVSVAMPKGKKSAITTTAYIPRRSFGFSTKTGNQSEIVVRPSEPEEAPKLNNNDESKRWSQTSYSSDRSGSSASSDETSLSNINAENNGLNRTTSNEQISVKNPEISRKIENHSENLSPRASPVLQRKWKATLVLPEEAEKVPSAKDRDIRISSTNAPRKNKFTNVRSMWEGK